MKLELIKYSAVFKRHVVGIKPRNVYIESTLELINPFFRRQKQTSIKV